MDRKADRQPQPAIIPEPGAHAAFLVLRTAPCSTPVRVQAQAREIARILAGTPRRSAQLAKEEPRARLVSSVSFGSAFWDLLSPAKRPAELHPFRAMTMDARSAVSTGGDVFLHIVSQRQDIAFELARLLRADLGSLMTVTEEVSGFRYKDSRDLTGFIDGSENPKGKARATAALIGDEDPDFSGGSYVFVQRYVHDLERWRALTTPQQEGVVGRTKKDSTELSDKKKPPSAHIARVVIEENGEELQIVRHSFPYGNTTEAGLYFVAYMRRLAIAEKMLRRMIGATEDGQHDRLLEFTRAVSGATFFAPSERLLASFTRG